MEIELACPNCHDRFTAAPALPAAAVLERMTVDGPWYALADGDTFEDMVFAALLHRGFINCPTCGRPTVVREKSIGAWVAAMANTQDEKALPAAH